MLSFVPGDSLLIKSARKLTDKLMPSSYYRTVYDSKDSSAKDVVADTVIDGAFQGIGKLKNLGKGIKKGLSTLGNLLSAKDAGINIFEDSQESILEDFMKLSDYTEDSLLNGVDNDDDAMSLANTFIEGVKAYNSSDYSSTGDKAGYASEILVPMVEEQRDNLLEDEK
ncbi:MAG: hypothetical protein JXR64_12285 [Spirochaetales bacterium]|nr:hypothetical protein [Spirochaetales bacterium]